MYTFTVWCVKRICFNFFNFPLALTKNPIMKKIKRDLQRKASLFTKLIKAASKRTRIETRHNVTE